MARILRSFLTLSTMFFRIKSFLRITCIASFSMSSRKKCIALSAGKQLVCWLQYVPASPARDMQAWKQSQTSYNANLAVVNHACNAQAYDETQQAPW